MHVSSHTAMYRTSVTTNMHFIGERFFCYHYRVQVTRALHIIKDKLTKLKNNLIHKQSGIV